MTVKFDKFIAALDALCREHEVYLSTTGYERVAVFDADEHDQGVDLITDETK